MKEKINHVIGWTIFISLLYLLSMPYFVHADSLGEGNWTIQVDYTVPVEPDPPSSSGGGGPPSTTTPTTSTTKYPFFIKPSRLSDLTTDERRTYEVFIENPNNIDIVGYINISYTTPENTVFGKSIGINTREARTSGKITFKVPAKQTRNITISIDLPTNATIQDYDATLIFYAANLQEKSLPIAFRKNPFSFLTIIKELLEKTVTSVDIPQFESKTVKVWNITGYQIAGAGVALLGIIAFILYGKRKKKKRLLASLRSN